METITSLLISLPHHNKLNPSSALAWDSSNNPRFPSHLILSTINHLTNSNLQNKEGEWGDTRSKYITSRQISFLKHILSYRAQTSPPQGPLYSPL